MRGNQYYDTLTPAQVPRTFPFPQVEKKLRDSLLFSPNGVLNVYNRAFSNEMTNYRSWNRSGIAVGYGMMPGNGNYWEDVSVGQMMGGHCMGQPDGGKRVKEMIMLPLFKNRTCQRALYNWVKPSFIGIYQQKDSILQAVDMFAVWKASEYLKDFNLQSEKKRSVSRWFTSRDWRGRGDDDAKMYAFWFRRISEYENTNRGFSLNDARYWVGIANRDMWLNASPATKKIFLRWQALWQQGTITDPNRFLKKEVTIKVSADDSLPEIE